MTQVSKRYIPPWTYSRILDVFLGSFLKIRDKNTASLFFDEFLTPTEKIMLAKRITCLYLIYKNVSILECADIIKLSTATVAKYVIFMQKTPTIRKVLEKILNEEKFMKLIDKIINEYLYPPGSVGTHWASAGREKIAYERRKHSPL
ncbi:hypothetical protein A2954_05500 [Candidatus Roizmanbacteria bacterium RIFCSPLOWO2_01_FULL_37_12]|uniref:TrpR like protein, YerC/YecD n=1 Tax=Candidatus Roizmanbacteria bacterium RIFCSPLOWO2_01_FULL_37_12 TaxID=1802056 RepID=A0A1F7I927_9BACT|nr:MAG: hypothetical protein A2954_05500 [Candidatus Roizmanbacteria bacterium RIFCSPLOWO2_01_FULL_37_12]